MNSHLTSACWRHKLCQNIHLSGRPKHCKLRWRKTKRCTRELPVFSADSTYPRYFTAISSAFAFPRTFVGLLLGVQVWPMSHRTEKCVRYAMWKVAGWVLPAFFGIGSIGTWLTGEFATSQLGRRTVEIICTSAELAGREAVQKPQSPAKNPLDQLEDQDRQLRLQIEICPDEKTQQQLIEKRNRCIQAQADCARHDMQITIRQKKNKRLSKVVLRPPTTCDERLRRRPYDAARQPPKPGSPTANAHVSDRRDDCR